MSLRNGFQRLSAVFWGAAGMLCLLGVLAYLFNSSQPGNALIMLIAMLLCYGAHKATCWIIRGFSGG